MKFQDFVQQAKNVQEQMQLHYQEFVKLKQEIDKNQYIGIAQEGDVRVTVNGRGQVISIYIAPEVLAANSDLVAELVKIATNEANYKIQQMIDDLINLLNKLFIYRGFDR